MSISIYNKASFDVSNLITRTYSTSFSLAIRVFDEEMRNAISSIYGFVRLADEIVDSFHEFSKRELLDDLYFDLLTAMEKGISLNPVLNSFQQTVISYKIPVEYINDFIESMKMDLTNDHYKGSEYDKYIYGSAEVVGLMCLHVFCKDDENLLRELTPSARALGSAFQKVNFLRDIKSDLDERGRIYLRDTGSEDQINNHSKSVLENEIEKEFKQALDGIKRLPYSSRLGVYSAYLYYNSLFKKIRSSKVEDLFRKRVRISNLTKLSLLISSALRIKVFRTLQ